MHYLLTVLGTNPRPATYTLGARRAEALLAPLALFELLDERERPDRVVALCTPEARADSWPRLRDGLANRCELQCVDVPSGAEQQDVVEYLRRAARTIPSGEEVQLSVDVTHGYRHFSFLTYIAVLYLSGLRGVRLRGAYYGMLNWDAPSPFLDLRPLLALPGWFHALQAFRETGSALPMATTLRAGEPGPTAGTIAQELSQISESYLSGLPIELGRQARLFLDQRPKAFRKVLREEHQLPLADEIVGLFGEILEPFALPEPGSGDGWKKRVALTRSELLRQADYIDDLLERENVATALGLMNEWVVSWVVWQRERGKGWLDYLGVRRRAASLLGALAAMTKDPALNSVLTEEQRALGRFWTGISALRNAYHHHGMRAQVLVGGHGIDQNRTTVLDYWRAYLRYCPEPSLTIHGATRGNVLVSPIGHRPGVLFSAVRAFRTKEGTGPDACLVVCSEATEQLIAEALARAGFTGTVIPLRLSDPYAGTDEIDTLAGQARAHLAGADLVGVNITGGTTLMGLVADAIGEQARQLARPVRRFGLIDRRSPQEQDADPYQPGEPLWLGSGGAAHDRY